VDKDLAFWRKREHPKDSNLFVTDGYSIENYMVSEDMFYILMTQIMGFGRATKAESIVRQFTALLTQFEEEMMEIMALCILAKEKDSNASLSEYSIHNALSFDLHDGEIVFHLSDSELFKAKTTWDIDDNEPVKILVDLFKDIPEGYHVRGKWLLYFMVSCGEFMRINYAFLCPLLKVKAEKRLRPICEIYPTKAVPVLGLRYRFCPKHRGKWK